MRFYGRKILLLGEKKTILSLCERRHIPKSSGRGMVTSLAADITAGIGVLFDLGGLHRRSFFAAYRRAIGVFGL